MLLSLALKVWGLISPPSTNELEGKKLRYLIGADHYTSKDNEIIEVSYDTVHVLGRGISIKYCNLFDEKNTKQYGPYLHSSETARQYGEGQIDPQGPGWIKNLSAQFFRASAGGFKYLELDNPDAYGESAVLGAISFAKQRGFKVLCKNPLVCSWNTVEYVKQCVGIIAEQDDTATPYNYDRLRKQAGAPTLPVWFVAFGDGIGWARRTAAEARTYKNMYVTYSYGGEYTTSVDI